MHHGEEHCRSSLLPYLMNVSTQSVNLEIIVLSLETSKSMRVCLNDNERSS